MLDASRTTHVSVAVERDIARSTVAVRAFRQRVDDQLVTMFGVELPVAARREARALPGRQRRRRRRAQGCTASLSTMIAGRVQGSLAYSLATAQMDPAERAERSWCCWLLRPCVRGPSVFTTCRRRFEADVPETATQVLVLYRVSNGFARPRRRTDGQLDRPGSTPDSTCRSASRCRSSISARARWEMLVAVRNFFRDTSDDQSVYDELLTIRPPKRIVGGVTVHF